MSRQEIEASFPSLRNSGYSITSPATVEYNCIAWASGDTRAWWWPDPMNLYYWPPTIPRENTLEAFIKAYELLGYGICKDGNYEEGFEKIANKTNFNILKKDIFYSGLDTLSSHLKFLVYWFIKKDYNISSSEQIGTEIRVIFSKTS